MLPSYDVLDLTAGTHVVVSLGCRFISGDVTFRRARGGYVMCQRFSQIPPFFPFIAPPPFSPFHFPFYLLSLFSFLFFFFPPWLSFKVQSLVLLSS